MQTNAVSFSGISVPGRNAHPSVISALYGTKLGQEGGAMTVDSPGGLLAFLSPGGFQPIIVTGKDKDKFEPLVKRDQKIHSDLRNARSNGAKITEDKKTGKLVLAADSKGDINSHQKAVDASNAYSPRELDQAIFKTKWTHSIATLPRRTAVLTRKMYRELQSANKAQK